MKMGLEFLDKLEQFMDSININGFTFHDLEPNKTYEWKARCGPQPLNEIEEVVAYRGQDIITYYFVKDNHLRSSELVNRNVDWRELNQKCHWDLLKIFKTQELRRFLETEEFADTFLPENRYYIGFLQFVLAISHSLNDTYEAMLQNDITSDAYFVVTYHKERGKLLGFSAKLLNTPFEEWLKKYGMDEYRKIVGIGKKTDVIVMTNKDLSKGDYNFTIPYASDWRDLVP